MDRCDEQKPPHLTSDLHSSLIPDFPASLFLRESCVLPTILQTTGPNAENIDNAFIAASLSANRHSTAGESELVSFLRKSSYTGTATPELSAHGLLPNISINEKEKLSKLLRENNSLLDSYSLQSLMVRSDAGHAHDSDNSRVPSAVTSSALANDHYLSLLEKEQLSKEASLSRLQAIRCNELGVPCPAIRPMNSSLLTSRYMSDIGMRMDMLNPNLLRLPLYTGMGIGTNTNIMSMNMNMNMNMNVNMNMNMNDRRALTSATGINSLLFGSRFAAGGLNTDVSGTTLSPPVKTKHGPIVVFMECDTDSLSEYQCLIRKQMEIFETDDSETNSPRNKYILQGQVGIRCRHCCHLPPQKRSKGAMHFPTKLDRIYQAAQNLAVFHLWEGCDHVPNDIRKKIGLLRERKSPAGGGKRYWGEGVRALGVVEEQPIGLRFR